MRALRRRLAELLRSSCMARRASPLLCPRLWLARLGLDPRLANPLCALWWAYVIEGRRRPKIFGERVERGSRRRL